MFARYYNSATGRFLSPDWSAKYEPVPYAKLDNPQSLNLYSYVYNNPLSHIDPDGHQCDTCKEVWNWLTSSHSASKSVSKSAAQSTDSNGGLYVTAKAGSGDASASSSYGKNTSVGAKMDASVAAVTINEGSHSTTAMNGLTANAGANAGLGLGGKAGIGLSGGAGANADVLTASQTESFRLGSFTITGTATGNVGIGASASFSLGTTGISGSYGTTLGFGGALAFGVSWGGVTATTGTSVTGTADKTTTKTNMPEVKPN
jgi:RHS repeat-associated protein